MIVVLNWSVNVNNYFLILFLWIVFSLLLDGFNKITFVLSNALTMKGSSYTGLCLWHGSTAINTLSLRCISNGLIVLS